MLKVTKVLTLSLGHFLTLSLDLNLTFSLANVEIS